MNVTTVPVGVGHGHRLHVVDGAADHRHPGRGQVDGARSVRSREPDEAELPVLAAPGGRGADTRWGSGRRGGSGLTMPRQVRNFP